MAPKRKNEANAEETTSREKKKLKITEARTIAVQFATPGASSTCPKPSNAVTTNSMKGLPSAIDVEKFAEARAFEINAMQTAIKTAGASSTQRAWQALPRHLRRRAASHDIRRVPLRLRERARAEMDPVRKKALGRSMPKRGKGKRISRTESFLKRQCDKYWLETHLWHAKRMKMENMWGYRLAMHPTEKAFRPSHRASIHGSIVHDASYYALVELKGPEYIIIHILQTFCDPQGPSPGSKRYVVGSRVLETQLYQFSSYPFDLIGPATVIWRPLVAPLVDEVDPVLPSQKAPKSTGAFQQKRTTKGKEKESSSPNDPKRARTVWLRFHPVMYDDVLDTLKVATSETLNKFRPASDKDRDATKVDVADLRGQVNVFEIMGPKGNQILKGALNPVSSETREDFRKFWSSLSDLQTSGSIPRGMVIGFKVDDPRLRFPPKNAKAKALSPGHVPGPLATFPSESLATSQLWDEHIRLGLSKPKYKKKDLDERRAKNLVPGTPLNALRQDDRVPVLLIQRSLEQSTGNPDTRSIHGWTLIIPTGWSMAFFSSLIFTGTRVGGQRERQTQAFEAGTPYFPRDFPFTPAYETYAEERMNEEKTRWEKKPPAKRVNFEKLVTKSPWKADWRGVLGLKYEEDHGSEGDAALVTTQRNAFEVTQVDEPSKARPWLLRGYEVPNILSSMSKMFNHSAALLSEINKLRQKRLQDPLSNQIKAADLLEGALVSVKAIICTRGAPEDLAMIYSVDDTEARRWMKTLQKSSGSNNESLELANEVPKIENLIGYVTTGHFSLSRGEGFAIGAIPLTRLLELQQQASRLHPNRNAASSQSPPLLVKVRNRNGHQCRAAHLEILAV
ncbi:NUC188 domain-containing protein [Crucibulum laeve]|uniref:NUC188 domain-containing protein n=1 Tax=Crucibulum laeve TaxID=68775 RepID=A0A5C3M9U7_9AGAR|nr:NUC188 domain-containing protein [Crucibulum laeve]